MPAGNSTRSEDVSNRESIDGSVIQLAGFAGWEGGLPPLSVKPNPLEVFFERSGGQAPFLTCKLGRAEFLTNKSDVKPSRQRNRDLVPALFEASSESN